MKEGNLGNIAVLANYTKPLVHDMIHIIKDWAASHQIKVWVSPNVPYREINEIEFEDPIRSSDLLITVGGDGTLLFGARLIGDSEVPLLSVNNSGSLGFHTQVYAEHLNQHLPMCQNFQSLWAWCSPRMMLQVSQVGNPAKMLALNDVTITRESWEHMVSLRVDWLNIDNDNSQNHITQILADALIVSTPFGSSAYNYAAHGPLMFPTMRAMSMTAVAPHNMSLSSLVLPDDCRLRIKVLERYQEAGRLLVDGKAVFALKPGDMIDVKTSSKSLWLYDARKDYFGDAHSKIGWGKGLPKDL